LKIDILTLFPDSFFGPFAESIVKRGIDNQSVDITCYNYRDYTTDLRRTVDDKPYGGGPGMLMKPEPIVKAVRSLKKEKTLVILTTPQGKLFKQEDAVRLSKYEHLLFVTGHYEGVDERVRDLVIDEEYSIGDYILTSGNLPAMVMVDAIVRLLPGVLGSMESTFEESHSSGTLEYPQYTRPVQFEGLEVPSVLRSGNHQLIAEWRKEQALLRTEKRRPDLLKKNKID
jgi:tRNA (guanine37-N1)-methyltransferase